MGKSAPKAPDPVQTANAQLNSNIVAAQQQEKLNNSDTYGPTGSVVHGFTPDGRTTTTTTLSPGQQSVYDNSLALTNTTTKAANDAATRTADYLATPLRTDDLNPFSTAADTAGLPALQSSLGTPGQGLQYAARNTQPIRYDFNAGQPLTRLSGAGDGLTRAIGANDFSADRDAVTGAILSRLAPQDARDRTDLEARLAAQGFTVGSQGYKDAADELNRRATDERMQAVLAGGQEQSRLFGLDQAQGQFANAAQAQAFGQQAQQAQFNNDAGTQEANAYNAALQAYNQAQSQGYGQAAQDVQLNNAAQGQAWDQASQAAAFNNTARGQGLNEAYAASDYENKLRAQQLAERLQLRAQPINEVSALFGLGTGVQAPQQAQTVGSQVAAPDYQGLVSNNYKAASQAASQGNSATASAVGAVATAAAIAI